jgi:hypothetical protein
MEPTQLPNLQGTCQPYSAAIRLRFSSLSISSRKQQSILEGTIKKQWLMNPLANCPPFIREEEGILVDA